MKWPSHIDSDYLEPFFFDAMRAGYASGDNGKPTRPGYVEISFEENEYELVDEWMNAPSPRGTSHGQTRIWYRDIPVWYMHYSGHYHKHALPIVRKSLGLAYTQGRFIGGRGVRYLELFDSEYEFVYTNSPDPHWDTFGSFRGVETVHCKGLLVGYHSYNGGLIT